MHYDYYKLYALGAGTPRRQTVGNAFNENLPKFSSFPFMQFTNSLGYFSRLSMIYSHFAAEFVIKD